SDAGSSRRAITSSRSSRSRSVFTKASRMPSESLAAHASESANNLLKEARLCSTVSTRGGLSEDMFRSWISGVFRACPDGQAGREALWAPGRFWCRAPTGVKVNGDIPPSARHLRPALALGERRVHRGKQRDIAERLGETVCGARFADAPEQV